MSDIRTPAYNSPVNGSPKYETRSGVIHPHDVINHGPINRRSSLMPNEHFHSNLSAALQNAHLAPDTGASSYTSSSSSSYHHGLQKSATNLRLATVKQGDIPRSIPKTPAPGQDGLLPPANIASARALTDTPLATTPLATAPSSPRIHATTLNIPGLTKSKVSKDGKIPNRDLGSKLVIVMVGLPARGKSYITKKMTRYLDWLQYDVRIFNVGNKRRVVASNPAPDTPPDTVQGAVNVLNQLTDQDFERKQPIRGTGLNIFNNNNNGNGVLPSPPKLTLNDTEYRVNGMDTPKSAANGLTNGTTNGVHTNGVHHHDDNGQNADFFDPHNKKAAKIREQVAMETLDDLLHYIMYEGGSVGILDATNSTAARREAVVERIRKVAGNELGVLFIESVCEDQNVLEANMRLKLSGPDYKGKDPEEALADFRKRVEMYEKAYEPIGHEEEKKGWQYIKLIDVGRKFVAHGIRGFLANHTAYYLMNFNLHPRQIWITRHGESSDNVDGRIGGDAHLSQKGEGYARALASFIDYQRKLYYTHIVDKHASTHFPPLPGDSSPPNPEPSFNFMKDGDTSVPQMKNFCVWTSMLKRSVETAQYFNDDEYDIKEWRMLDELNAGIADGKTYEEIRSELPDEYRMRQADKLKYRYPGPGGESYLDVIHRLKEVIVEVERMTDHVLLVGHRVIARVLLAYFMGLDRNTVADLDVPLGMLYVLEPKPYGVDFKAFKYDCEKECFEHIEGYELLPACREKAERECLI